MRPRPPTLALLVVTLSLGACKDGETVDSAVVDTAPVDIDGDGSTMADWMGLMSESINNMSRFRERSAYLQWCDINSSADADLEFRWDFQGVQSDLGSPVTGLGYSSLHHDNNCGDESRLYRVEVWVR